MNISYSNPVLREFERELDPFRNNKGTFDMDRYLISKGIFAAVEGYPPSLVESRIKDYEAFLEKYRALNGLQNRTSLAKKHEAEERESMV